MEELVQLPVGSGGGEAGDRGGAQYHNYLQWREGEAVKAWCQAGHPSTSGRGQAEAEGGGERYGFIIIDFVASHLLPIYILYLLQMG